MYMLEVQDQAGHCLACLDGFLRIQDSPKRTHKIRLQDTEEKAPSEAFALLFGGNPKLFVCFRGLSRLKECYRCQVFKWVFIGITLGQTNIVLEHGASLQCNVLIAFSNKNTRRIPKNTRRIFKQGMLVYQRICPRTATLKWDVQSIILSISMLNLGAYMVSFISYALQLVGFPCCSNKPTRCHGKCEANKSRPQFERGWFKTIAWM